MTDLAVVGGGPAGLAAASAAAAAGLRVVLIEEYPEPGGQYLAGLHEVHTEAQAHGASLLACLPESGVEVWAGTLVWGLRRAPGGFLLSLRGPEGTGALGARTVVLATGARERVVPFPGWTLPGVMTAGGAGRLVRTQGVLPGRRILLAGSGPLLLPVAHDLVRAGGRVVAVLEATRRREWLPHLPALWGQGGRVREGREYLHALREAAVPYHFGRGVVRASGGEGVRTAVVAALDGEGRPARGSAETLEVDAVCVGSGLIPEVVLARLAGCEVRRDPARGGWVPRVDDRMETEVPGLFAAGEASGVGGAETALVEGRVAGLAAAWRLRRIPEADLAEPLETLDENRRRNRRFEAVLNRVFVPGRGAFAALPDATVVCRCEGVTAGQVRAAARAGARDLTAMKSWCRAGQGNCQGRTCGDLVARVLAVETEAEARRGYSTRPPTKPVSLGDLAAYPRPPEGDPVESPPRASARSGSVRVDSADVVVVGGGIVGAGCAYYLSEAGLSVRLVERSVPAAGTSGACDGILLLWDKQPGPELELGRMSAPLWRELSQILAPDVEYQRRGTLMLAESEEALAACGETARKMTAAGVRNELLDGAGVRELEPRLAPDLAGGFWFPDDAQLDPRRATVALLQAARRRGLRLHQGTRVEEVVLAAGRRVSGVRTSRGRIDAPAVVLAAGVWSPDLVRGLGVDLPVRPRKGHVLVTERVPGMLRRPCMEGGYVGTVGAAADGVQVALVAEPTAAGTLLLGSSREFAGLDGRVSPAVLSAMAERTLRFLPELRRHHVIRSYAGFRPWSPDHLPMIGPVPGAPGLFAATGHEGAGICLAPITGKLVTRWVRGEPVGTPGDAVVPGRFGTS